MPVESLSPAAKTYLAAIGASAVYICTEQGRPISVGVARDFEQALRHLRTLVSPHAQIDWVAWAMNYEALLQISQVPDLIYVNGVNGLRMPRRVDDLAELIEQIASENGISLTAHARALERAEVYAGYLDTALQDMQRNGTFATFNAAYKVHRTQLARKGEQAQPYWAVMQDLRAIIIRNLVTEPKNRLDAAAIIPEIRKRFPWFIRPTGLHKPKRR